MGLWRARRPVPRAAKAPYQAARTRVRAATSRRCSQGGRSRYACAGTGVQRRVDLPRFGPQPPPQAAELPTPTVTLNRQLVLWGLFVGVIPFFTFPCFFFKYLQ